MNIRYSRLFFVAILLLFLLVKPVFAVDGMIQKVEYVNSEENLESVVFYLNGAYLPKVFAIKGDSPRVVFDFFDTLLDRKAPTSITANGRVVKQIRLGRHGDRTRVVIDLTASEGYRFDQSFDDVENILTIMLFSDTVSAKEEVVTEPATADTGAILVVDSIPAKEDVFPGSAVTKEKPVDTAKESSLPQEVVPPAISDKQMEPKAVVNQVAETVEAKTAPGDGNQSNQISDPLLTNISFENTSNNGEMVLFKLNGFFPPTVAGEEAGTPRVVCQFPGTKVSGTVLKDQETNGQFVSRIRVLQPAGKNQVRVVLELVPNKNYDLQQVFFKEDNLFVVIVNSYDEKDASPVKDAIKK